MPIHGSGGLPSLQACSKAACATAAALSLASCLLPSTMGSWASRSLSCFSPDAIVISSLLSLSHPINLSEPLAVAPPARSSLRLSYVAVSRSSARTALSSSAALRDGRMTSRGELIPARPVAAKSSASPFAFTSTTSRNDTVPSSWAALCTTEYTLSLHSAFKTTVDPLANLTSISWLDSGLSTFENSGSTSLPLISMNYSTSLTTAGAFSSAHSLDS